MPPMVKCLGKAISGLTCYHNSQVTHLPNIHNIHVIMYRVHLVLDVDAWLVLENCLLTLRFTV